MSVQAEISQLLARSAAPAQHGLIREYPLIAKVFHWVTVALVFAMVAVGVSATQFNDGPVADILFALHKLTGVATLAIVVLRIGFRLARGAPRPRGQSVTRPLLHWTLYGIILLVPLLGWAGVSAGNDRELFFGFSLLPILPEGDYGSLLLHVHAYLAFTLLALVALHIGLAMQDYLVDERH
jgi:cytochrome b561